MSNVIKNNIRVFRIESNGDYATIAVDGWVGNNGSRCGELIVHSSLGSWGRRWSDMGVDIDCFVASIEKDYFAEKLLGTRAMAFDANATVSSWKRGLVDLRHRRALTADELREIWDLTCYTIEGLTISRWADIVSCATGEAIDNPETADIVDAVFQSSLHYSPEPRVQRFWERLWLPFIGELRGASVSSLKAVAA